MGHLAPIQCKYCNLSYIKKGWYNTTQKYFCKVCSKYQCAVYTYQLLSAAEDFKTAAVTKEAMSISSVSRILQIPTSTVSGRLLNYNKTINSPVSPETNQIYEADEMQTYIDKRQISCFVYITYAINRKTKQIIDFVTGKRSKEVIGKLINKLITLSPGKIYTDGLNIYPGLIPKPMHCCFKY